ncbi:MAG: CRISPR-associated helicase Cas3' [Chthonomonadaceae bacterium]|nr:CRISPR-associated helicase Cas3' [Chthonomonadaceae bacterium]
MQLTPFQQQSLATLQQEKSTLLIAPTGFGKTRAAIEPCVTATEGGLLGTRIVYTLPVRALAGGVHKELNNRLQIHNRNMGPITVHHGQQTDSELFRERAIITTIDQYLTAFAGAPLSFSARSGHAAAGALLTSYSVFDEVHLLDARAGLPLLFATLCLRQDWGLLSCVMTATLPRNLIAHFQRYLDLTVIRAEEVDPQGVAARDRQRQVTVHYTEDTPPDATTRARHLLQAWQQHRRVIAFCNTVSRAIELYNALRNTPEVDPAQLLLAHSRFTPTDRKAKDALLTARFGEHGEGGILITTQVAEAGLDISAPIVFTELAPADALIQRAGRCARFFRQATPEHPLRGQLIVWPVVDPDAKRVSDDMRRERSLPYDVDIVERTRKFLQKLHGQQLNWEREQQFIDDCLAPFYAEFVSGQNPGKEARKTLRDPEKDAAEPEENTEKNKRNEPAPLTPVTALGVLERAFHAADARYVEDLIRDSLSVDVAIVQDFQTFEKACNEQDGHNRQYPETISMRLSTFRNLFLSPDKPKQVRELRIERSARRNSRPAKPAVQLIPVRTLRPGATYLVLASEAGYSTEQGLTGAGNGDPTPLRTPPEQEKGLCEQDGPRQTFQQHAMGAFQEARRIAALYRPFLTAWARNLPRPADLPLEELVDTLQQALCMAALMHDIGKLNDSWQQAVGRHDPAEPPIARTTRQEREALRQQGKPRPPHHAHHAYPFLRFLLRHCIGDYRMLDHLALAAARHHTITLDGDVPAGEFQWTPGGQDVVQQVIAEAFDRRIDPHIIAAACQQLTQETLADEAPGPAAYSYFLYCLANRLVIHADRCDAGGRPLELTSQESPHATH